MFEHVGYELGDSFSDWDELKKDMSAVSVDK